ncbi:MAG: class I tRNA ligase family protein, partial [Proteobacteria bacterium]|nr:class I tRNA ligase family protein [Pseudomonadota bacterium]
MNDAAADDLRYDFGEAEPRWQRAWAERACFAVDDVPAAGKPKYYVLEMFPYPSGKIHMGHVRNYTLGDVVARYKRARGHAVLHPMGWDAFGLPAENAARERGIHPAKWTWDNIAAMRAELQRMGLSLDWSREFATCDPSYYGHQQKLFLDFLKAGLVDRKESWVNWDPVDGTVLANEQVIDGRGWRSGAPVEKKRLAQWFLRITDYAPELLEALGGMDRWPERVRLMQSHWIGRSEGARLKFALTAPEGATESVEVYTTRPDTLYGMSFLALAREHPLAAAIAAPLIAGNPDATSWTTIRKPPSAAHWMGTDENGRDVFARVVFGARASLLAGLVSVLIACGIGIPVGLLAGFAGGRTDALIGRFVDAMLACPFLILAIALAAFLGPDLTNAMIAIGISATPVFVRVARAATMEASSAEYVEAARALGNPPWRVALRHVLPNIIPPVLVQATLAIATAIIAEASLSFLGLGQQP